MNISCRSTRHKYANTCQVVTLQNMSQEKHIINLSFKKDLIGG